MNTFINETVNEIARSYNISYKCYKFNYFDLYQRSFSELKEDDQIKIYNIIEKNETSIDRSSIKDIIKFLSYDISNESVIPNNVQIRNYIIFCIYCYVLEAKIDNVYFNEHNILRLEYKDRPHRFIGSVYTYNENSFICDVNAFRIDHMKPFKGITKKLEKLNDENMVVPYCDKYDDMIVYEKLQKLDPYKDPLITVLKDLVNQLKSINKYYWFEYIDKDDIGKSNINFQRYYMMCFESLIGKKKKITSFNIYDGRDNYTKMSNKDQIRTVIHILSDIYVTGNDSYKQKCKLEPFNGYISYVEKLEESNCHDEFIYYLMDIKI